MSFYKELQRRNVFRVTAAYLALSWVITQVTGAVVPALHLPDSIPSIVVWLAVIGFPFVILFSWVYEFTPEGLKRESEVDHAASIPHVTSKRLDYIIIAMLAVAIGLFAFDRFLPVGAPESENEIARDYRAQSAATDNRVQDVLLQEETTASALVVDDKSIAVLPFTDMSAAKDQEYMSDGIAEELLNLLAQVSELKVIARTSSFAFKGKDVDIAEIAKKLNVAHVLEGSVRKSGNTVRITAQLVRTADSTHLWSETYNRPLDDIFAVQDEIAGAIVQALQIRLAGGELSRRKGGTQNLEAYQLYLRGMSALNENTESSLDAAEAHLEQAIKIDPGYGMAWSSLAWAVIVRADSGFLDMTEGYERARQVARHALELSPNLAEAHAARQWVLRVYDRDLAAAAAEGQKALAIDPTNWLVLNGAGMLSLTLGRWDDAERQFRAALIRDPLNSFINFNLGMVYHFSGRFPEAEDMYRRVLEIEPGFLWTRHYLARVLLADKRPEEALAIAQQEVDKTMRQQTLAIILQAFGSTSEADEALNTLIRQWADIAAYHIALAYACRGDNRLALEWLERAYQQRDSALPEILGEPLFKNLADDPRFKAFLRKMNLPDLSASASGQQGRER